MKLELENGQTIQDPNTLEIEDHLRTLDGESNGYAILSQSELSYMQAAGGCETGLTVEYQDGSTDQHYSSAAGGASLHDVVEAFRAYAVSDDRWKTMFEWEKLDF